MVKIIDIKSNSQVTLVKFNEVMSNFQVIGESDSYATIESIIDEYFTIKNINKNITISKDIEYDIMSRPYTPSSKNNE